MNAFEIKSDNKRLTSKSQMIIIIIIAFSVFDQYRYQNITRVDGFFKNKEYSRQH